MTNLTPFNYEDHQVRVVTIEGEPWFVLADLAKVLDIKDVQRLNSRLDDGVRQTHPIQDRLGRTQNATIVSEPGMYEVVIRSDKPEAIAFRRWITTEVLPSIRKTGSYGVQQELTGPELMAKALIEANQTMQALTAKVEQLEVPAANWEVLASTDGYHNISDAGRILQNDSNIDTTSHRIFKQLQLLGWIGRPNGKAWRALQKAISKGWMREVMGKPFHNSKTGEMQLGEPKAVITPDGMEKLREVLPNRTEKVA